MFIKRPACLDKLGIFQKIDELSKRAGPVAAGHRFFLLHRQYALGSGNAEGE
jgi:hypothetical protein